MIITALMLSATLTVALAGAHAASRSSVGDGGPARLEVDPAFVGQPTQIRWHIMQPEPGRAAPILLSLTITHIEKETKVFSLEGLPTDGRFSMGFQFTDGSAHRVSAVARMDGPTPIVAEQIIAVSAAQPPLRSLASSLGFFSTVIALGIVAGRISAIKSKN